MLKRLFCGRGEVQVAQVGGEAVRQPTLGTEPDVPVPRNMRELTVGWAGIVVDWSGVEGGSCSSIDDDVKS